MLTFLFSTPCLCVGPGCLCVQLGESLEEQLGQRLLRMPPPPQLPPRVRQGQQHTIEQQQQPSMFQLPYELPPVLGDPMQVGGREGKGKSNSRSSSCRTCTGLLCLGVMSLRTWLEACPEGWFWLQVMCPPPCASPFRKGWCAC